MSWVASKSYACVRTVSAQTQVPIKNMKHMKIIKYHAKPIEQFTEMSVDIYSRFFAHYGKSKYCQSSKHIVTLA